MKWIVLVQGVSGYTSKSVKLRFIVLNCFKKKIILTFIVFLEGVASGVYEYTHFRLWKTTGRTDVISQW